MVQAVLEEDEAVMLCGKRIRSQFGGWETSVEAVQARHGKG